jgi:hypothetical protein
LSCVFFILCHAFFFLCCTVLCHRTAKTSLLCAGTWQRRAARQCFFPVVIYDIEILHYWTIHQDVSNDINLVSQMHYFLRL